MRRGQFGGAFSLEQAEFEVLVGYPSLDVQQEVQCVGLPTGIDLGIINLQIVTEAADDVGSMCYSFAKWIVLSASYNGA